MQSLKNQMAPGLWWTGKLAGHHKVVTWTMRRCSWPSTVKRGAELLPMANRFAPGSIMLRTILPLSHGIFPTVRHLRGCFQRWPQSRYMLDRKSDVEVRMVGLAADRLHQLITD